MLPSCTLERIGKHSFTNRESLRALCYVTFCPLSCTITFLWLILPIELANRNSDQLCCHARVEFVKNQNRHISRSDAEFEKSELRGGL